MSINFGNPNQIQNYFNTKTANLYNSVANKFDSYNQNGTKIQWLRLGIPFIELGASLMTIAGRVSAIAENLLKGLWNVVSFRNIPKGSYQILLAAPGHAVALPVEAALQIPRILVNLRYCLLSSGSIKNSYQNENDHNTLPAAASDPEPVASSTPESAAPSTSGPAEATSSTQPQKIDVTKMTKREYLNHCHFANSGNRESQIIVAQYTLLKAENKYDGFALQQYETLARHGNPGAMWLAGFMYSTGFGVEKNLNKAKEHLNVLSAMTPPNDPDASERDRRLDLLIVLGTYTSELIGGKNSGEHLNVSDDVRLVAIENVLKKLASEKSTATSPTPPNPEVVHELLWTFNHVESFFV